MNKPSLRVLGTGIALVLLTACHSVREPDFVTGPDYQAVNVFQTELPPDLQRVAVLPLTVARNDRNHASGRTTLEPLLQRGLTARQAFEVAHVSADWLRRETGQPAWRLDEPLPPGLLEHIREAYGCEAVLFVHLSEYAPYPPLRIGWQGKLLGNANRVIWSVDELFDASQPSVVNSARRYYQRHQWGVSANGHSRDVLDSPRRFGAYTVSAALETLGARSEEIAKVVPATGRYNPQR